MAEIHYGVALTSEEVGRARLPEIRRKETLAAGRILGVRKHYFWGQKDARFALDSTEAAHIWDTRAVSHFRMLAAGKSRIEPLFARLKAAPACACS